MKAESKSVSTSRVRKEWEPAIWTTARSLVAILMFSSSPSVSCCGSKASQEGGGAGETESQLVARPEERRSPQEREWRRLKKGMFLKEGT